MANNIHVVKTNDFVRLDAHGKVNLAESRRILSEVAKTCFSRGVNCGMLDVRDLQPSLSLSDLYTLVWAFKEMGFTHAHRLAVLHRYESTERAEFFAMCAESSGWHVRAFDEYEEAMEWFQKEDAVKPETK